MLSLLSFVFFFCFFFLLFLFLVFYAFPVLVWGRFATWDDALMSGPPVPVPFRVVSLPFCQRKRKNVDRRDLDLSNLDRLDLSLATLFAVLR